MAPDSLKEDLSREVVEVVEVVVVVEGMKVVEAGPVVLEVGAEDGAPCCAGVEAQVPRLAHLGQTWLRPCRDLGEDLVWQGQSRERSQRDFWSLGGLAKQEQDKIYLLVFL